MTLADKKLSWAMLAGLIALVFYLVPWRKDRGGGDTVPAELLPIAILDGKGLYLDQFRGDSTDLPYYLNVRDGRVLSNYPILPGVLNVPTFAAARLAGYDLYHHRKRLSWLTAVAVTAASSVFLCLWLMRVGISDRQSFGWTLLYSLGTCAWSVASTSLNQHGPSLFLLTLGLYLLSYESSPLTLIGSGLAFGFAVMNRPANIALVIPLALYAIFRSRPRSLWFVAGATLPAGILAWYSLSHWGSLTALGQGPAILFHGSIMNGLLGLLFSPSHGLLVFTPIFVLAYLQVPDAIRRGGIDLAITAGLLLSLLLYARWSMWWGGGSFGYRLLSEHAPFLTLFAAIFWARHRVKRFLRPLLVFMASWSILVHGLGAFLYPSGFDSNIDIVTSKLWSVPDTEITRLALIAARKFGLAHAPAPVEMAPRMQQDAATWWSPILNDDTIPGWPDSPIDGQSVHGQLEIHGWARSASGHVEVQALLDGGRQIVPLRRVARPDVGTAFPHLGDISQAGFHALVPPPAAPPGEHVILFEMRAPNGKVRRIGPVTFRWSRD